MLEVEVIAEMRRPRAAPREESGFTVVELMISLLIISILIAIAIPTFNGARRSAQDRMAQSNLRNGLLAQKTFYVDSQDFADDAVAADLATLREIESNMTWDEPDAWLGGVDVYDLATFVVNDDGVALQSISKSTRVFCIADVARNVPDGGTWFASVPTGSACPALDAGMAGWTKDASAGWRY
jgi:type IV pilus assembly protein PilA